MRDHPAHGASMLGGTWGAKVVNQRKDFFLAFKKLFMKLFNLIFFSNICNMGNLGGWV